MADARDLKSRDYKKSCGFKSRHRHQTSKQANELRVFQLVGKKRLNDGLRCAGFCEMTCCGWSWRQYLLFGGRDLQCGGLSPLWLLADLYVFIGARHLCRFNARRRDGSEDFGPYRIIVG